MQHPRDHIFEFNPETLAAWCTQRGMAGFRAKQILEWVYQKGVADPAQMTSLSKRDRDLLSAEMVFLSGQTVASKAASDGTKKLLVQWDEFDDQGQRISDVQTSITGEADSTDAVRSDGGVSLNVLGQGQASDGAGVGVVLDPSRQTECVMIPVDATDDEGKPVRRRTACISSQVGCPVGCKFCASGIGGLEGNLSAGRIVEQVWRLGRLDGVSRISNVVFMGMGEPLSNMQNVIGAIRVICSLWGLGISARKVTISTVGLPKAIEKLAEELELPVTLALSLHAPTDEIRRSLIPWANYTTIDELLDACDKWFRKTGREITLEYTLLREINDRGEHAEKLASLAKSLRANVNLIRYNEVAGMPFNRPRTDDVLRFQKILDARGVNSHIRASRGRDIAAACGQLRHETGPKAK
ncbi:MAG: 23S rRNA (adenine(2503)-C(2))-methyltransferase RlmN [Phycisphaerales bacterium]|nr:23S rRNA (adenine(2503)-C(2))-methyltransferase RlmN [Phycisphaerales bacterium]